MTPALLDTSGLRADSSSVLADLSSDSLIRLRMSVSEFRSSGRRLIGELYVMTQQLCVMQEILGDNFRSFVQSELDLGNRMISRYMHINKVLKTHFSHNGQVDLSEANAFTQRALALLSPTTDSHVVDELRVIASQGKNIDHHVVMEAMNKAEADAVAQLASAQADLAGMDKAKLNALLMTGLPIFLLRIASPEFKSALEGTGSEDALLRAMLGSYAEQLPITSL